MDLEAVERFFSSNATLVAILNVAGVLAIGTALVKGIQRAIGLARESYRTTLRHALLTLLVNRRRSARRAAHDVHFYLHTTLSRIVSVLFFATLSTISIVMYLGIRILAKLPPPDERIIGFYDVQGVVSIISLIFFMVTVNELLFYQKRVTHQRRALFHRRKARLRRNRVAIPPHE